MIRLTDLSLAFRERLIFKKITTQFADRARVGLVGDNGAGKTTLLRVLAGEMTPDDGRVETIPGALRIGYLPQDMAEMTAFGTEGGSILSFLRDRAGISDIASRMASLEERISSAPRDEARALLASHERLSSDFAAMGGYEFDSTAKKILRGLGFAPGDDARSPDEFSGGWKMRISLAAVLVSRPDVLLLDEPTNHLDSEAMEWLEGWLRDFAGTIIFVSHDRRFLGKIAREIAELARGELTRWPMGYEEFVIARGEAASRRAKMVEAQRDEIDRMQKFIDRFRYKATKATQVQSRIKRLEKMEIIEGDAAVSRVKFRFPEAERSGREVLAALGLAKSYGGHTVYSGLDLAIERGERIALVGANGAGKSTLLRALCGVERPDAGSVKLGYNVSMGYYSQESAQELDYGHTVREEARRFGGAMDEAEKRTLLGAFLFSGDDIEKPVSVLSGGEKSRLALFKLMLSDTNFLLLDEPTNHLDMATREIFQQALLDYGGTLLIVSHDRYFLDALATRVIEIRDGALRSYVGNYSYFIERREREAEEKKDAAEPQERPTPERRDKRAEADRRNEIYRARKVFADQIAPIEARIDRAERRIAEIDAQLAEGAAMSRSDLIRELMIERKKLDGELSADMEEWERLSEEMERAGREL